ncbi:cytochrome c3 family protein [Persephonella sp. IF05-L8]|uniref:cytochrome c3 family protein n=1 Tax=Persephonella sp. IF05-L8 TaxID=1158338 RepID=UPI000495195F
MLPFYILFFVFLNGLIYAVDFPELPFSENAEYEKGIRSTKHNLAEFDGRVLNPNIMEDYPLSLCAWCHTQNINVSFIGVEYKWDPQKTVEKFPVYAQAKNGTLFRNISPSSMLCLSCHDGANAPNIVFGKSDNGASVHSHPVFIIYKQNVDHLKSLDSPLIGWEGKKHFVYDLVKDYNDRIQCASCHDPHSPNPLFLRTTNKGSRLCRGCHAI